MKIYWSVLIIIGSLFLLMLGIRMHFKFIEYTCEQVIEKKITKNAFKCFNEGC